MIQYEATISNYLGAEALAAARADARASFPKESCGFVTTVGYVACINKSKTPLEDFEIDDPRYDHAVKTGAVIAIIHSHPNGTIYPSLHDMQQQAATDVAWGIITLNEQSFGQMTIWGGAVPTAPILGRPFVHGIFDCYSAIRDTFAAGKEEMHAQGIGWPFQPITLPQVPRGDGWWQSGADLYTDHLKPEGFVVISRSEARPGDGFLIKVGNSEANPHDRLNHAGLLVDHNMILHHLPGRLSRREPSGIWARAADLWVRYEGPGA